jgi:hypothetical protein
MRQLFVVSPDRAALVTAAAVAITLGAFTLARAPSSAPTTPAPSPAYEAVLIEPPGGPWISGLTAPPNHTVALDGGAHQLSHAHGQGTLVGFTVPHCTKMSLEVARQSPAPTLITVHDEPSGTVYVPDGIYDLTILCDGRREGTPTRLIVGN